MEENFELPEIDCLVEIEKERNIDTKADVMQVVESDLDLKIVYAKSQAGHELTGSDQVIISKSLVKYLLQQNVKRELDAFCFRKMATAIIETFDSEVQLVYYVPSAKKKPAKGKLWDAYNNLRSKLAKFQIISRRSRVYPGATQADGVVDESQSQAEDSEDLDSSQAVVDTEESELDNFIKILKNSTDPDNLSLMWAETCQFRIDSIKDSDVVSYMQNYPCLLTNSGYKLFEIDVKHLHPSFVALSDIWHSLLGIRQKLYLILFR